MLIKLQLNLVFIQIVLRVAGTIMVAVKYVKKNIFKEEVCPLEENFKIVHWSNTSWVGI